MAPFIFRVEVVDKAGKKRTLEGDAARDHLQKLVHLYDLAKLVVEYKKPMGKVTYKKRAKRA
jgi:hypothetical protein